MVLIVKQILLVSTIGDKQRTVCRTCSHFRLSRGQQIRQQFANSREKGDFFIITFWIIKKEFDNSAPAYQGVFFPPTYLLPIRSQHSFKNDWKQFLILITNLFYTLCFKPKQQTEQYVTRGKFLQIRTHERCKLLENHLQKRNIEKKSTNTLVIIFIHDMNTKDYKNRS